MSKPKRVVYHVTHNKDSKNDWKLIKAGSKRATKLSDNKERLIKLGRKLAKRKKLGQLKIHNQKGRIQTEYTYGSDPEKYKS